MSALSRMIAVLIGVALLAFAGTAWAGDDDDDKDRPSVSGTAVDQVTSSSAVLKGSVDPNKHLTKYYFEYGPTTAYGSPTTLTTLPFGGDYDSPQPVSAAVTGLQASTIYHYRLVAYSSKGTTRGPDRSFMTLANVVPDPGQPVPPPAEAPVAPELGSSVVVAPAAGELRVRRPGSSSFEALTSGSKLPLGSEVDASAGALALTSALPSGATQTGNFGGGRFVIRQSKRGYVDLYLRGGYCPQPKAGAATVARAARASKRRLWGHDHGGRFRTHGRNSHATVRGTRWVVRDTCAGTLTAVGSGSVVVRDEVRKKNIRLDAGEHYLARPRH